MQPKRKTQDASILPTRGKLFEVEEDVHDAFGGVGAEPVADVFVVDREIAEDLGGFILEFGEIGFEFGFVEEFARLNGKRFVDFAIRGDRNSCEDEVAHFEGSAFGHVCLIGNRVRRFVERFGGFDFCFKIAAPAVFFLRAIPAGKYFFAIGNVVWLETKGCIESIRREK